MTRTERDQILYREGYEGAIRAITQMLRVMCREMPMRSERAQCLAKVIVAIENMPLLPDHEA